MSSTKPYKLGLALSGGGAKGFAHAGALQAMEEFDLHPDIIAGTSAGAVVGSLYSAGYKPKEICELFMDKSFTNFTQITLPKSGFFSPEKFVHFLQKKLGYNLIEDLPIPLRVVASDLDHGKSMVFTEGKLAERVTASASVPIWFVPTRINGVHYVDGGVFCNFPVNVIREECETVIGVNVSPLVARAYKQSIIDIAMRAYSFMFRANTIEASKNCDVLIEMPDALQFDIFDLDNVEKIFQLGYDYAYKVLQEYIQKK